MLPNKMTWMTLMSTWPVVGKYFRRKVISAVTEELKTINKGFTSPSVSFTHNIHKLNAVLQGLDVHLDEDFGVFRGLTIELFTNTSNNACELLERLKTNNNVLNFDDYFKHSSNKPRLFLDWYSNQITLFALIKGTVDLIKLYTELNPINEEGVAGVINPKGVTFITKSFLESWCFKLLVKDLIFLLQLMLDLELKENHEQEN